jgi:WD domain, G-beta repeat.
MNNSNQSLAPLVSISMSLDSQHLIVASQDRTIRIVDIKNKDIVTTIENAHQGIPISKENNFLDAITHIQISSDNRYVISGSADKAIKIWDSSLYLDPINAYPTYRSNSENGANLAKVIEGINSKESQLVEENKKLLFELEILKKKYNELKNSMSQNHEVKTADQNSILTNDFFLKTESLPKNMPSLFLSVAFLMNEISSKSLKDLALVSKTILYVKKYASASILKYSGSFRQEELKNKTPEEYIKTLEEESYLGNVVDLKALSHHYKVSITVIRPTAKEGIKAESINEKEYNKAIFLLNDTKKSPNSYEPIVGSNESEEEIKVFSQEIYGEIKKEVISLVEGLSSI